MTWGAFLRAAVGPFDVTLPVTSVPVYPIYPYVTSIENEMIAVLGCGPQEVYVNRGQMGTDQVAHAAGAAIGKASAAIQGQDGTGPQGPAGPVGPIGPTGAAGAAGAIGPAGPPGPTGNTGLEGPPGATGGVGPQGPIGQTGPAGSTGATGPTGQAGTPGVKGDTGATGTTGAQGIQGLTGNTGPQGIQGIQGPIGNTGPAGVSSIPVYVALPNDTLALAFGTNSCVKLTVTANRTLTSTVPVAGTQARIIILTAGSSSFTITFGSGFKPVSTLATGTTTARVFVVTFISDGTNLYEASRTAAMVA